MDSRRWIAYWLNELGETESASLEAHLFDCAACCACLERLVALGNSVRKLHKAGEVAAFIPSAFVRKIRDAGMVVREYRLAPQGSVNCTVAPDDDFVVSHLQMPLAGVNRLDAILENVEVNTSHRLADIPFNTADDEVVLLPSIHELRPVDRLTLRVSVIAVDPGGERTLGVYTFNHRHHTMQGTAG